MILYKNVNVSDPKELMRDSWTGLAKAQPLLDSENLSSSLGIYQSSQGDTFMNEDQDSTLSITTAAETALSSGMSAFSFVSAVPNSKLAFNTEVRMELSRVDSALGQGVALGFDLDRESGESTARVSATAESDQAHREVFSGWLDGAKRVDFKMWSGGNGGADAHFFVKPTSWPGSSEDVAQLRRLGAARINLTLHEGQDSNGKKVLDVKAHLAGEIVNVRYGADANEERGRLLRHAFKTTARRAWARQKLDKSFLDGYEVVMARDVEDYPELATDPDNVRFVKKKKNKRTSKG